MFKTFSLFGLICVADPTVLIHGENCFNFWEQPIVHYKSLNACNNAGKMMSIKIRSGLEQRGLTITEGELWCIETTKGQKS
jgi:hypothetical protein